MTTADRIWLTPQTHDRLSAELAALLTAPTQRATRDSIGDTDELVTMTRSPRDLRIRQIRDVLNNAMVGQDPPDDGIAEPGMVLTIRYDDTGETETFLLGLRDVERNDSIHHGDLEVYSPDSPLGTALTGAHRGDQRFYRVPNGTTMRVTLLDAVPYGQHHRPQYTPS